MDKENMRPVIKEEREAIDKYIASLSIVTDFNIWDLQEQVYDAYRNKGYADGYNQALEDFSEKLCTILEEYQTGFNMVSMANVWHFSKEVKEELTR